MTIAQLDSLVSLLRSRPAPAVGREPRSGLFRGWVALQDGGMQIRIRLVTDAIGAREALDVANRVWGPGAAVDHDTYFVVAVHGGYLAIAEDGDDPVGMCFGFLSDGGRGLHSHMAGVVPSHAGRGVGAMLKHHQRAWAAERGLTHVSWTYDPLQRPNAWFNLVKLGARPVAYHVNYYGPLDDDINRGDETDRFEVHWPVAGAPTGTVEPGPGDTVVATPDAINPLRRSDPAAALDWRRRVRSAIVSRLDDGHHVAGLTTDGSYVLRRTR